MSKEVRGPTFDEASAIVNDCIRRLVGRRPFEQHMSLREVGIHDLSLFKMALREALYNRYGPGKEWRLGFSVDDKISTVIDVVVREAREPDFLLGIREQKAKKGTPKRKGGAFGGGGGGGVKGPPKRWQDRDGALIRRTPFGLTDSRRGGRSRSGGSDRADRNAALLGSDKAKGKASGVKGVRTFEASPQMKIRKELIPGKKYRLGLLVNQDKPARGAEVTPVVAVLPTNMRKFELAVWFDASHHFELDTEGREGRLTVDVRKGISDELAFTLSRKGRADGIPMYVSAFFRYNERPCGKITRYLEFKGKSLVWKDYVPAPPETGEVVLPNSGTPGMVMVEVKSTPADIRVEVLVRVIGGQKYTLNCFAKQGNGKWQGNWDLPQVSKDLVNIYMQNFMQNKGPARVASLEGAGVDLWSSLPEGARSVILTAIEKGAKSISILSEEPYIPWELMKPYRDINNPRQPLGVELRMGRWITGDYQSAKQKISLKSGYVICPTSSGLEGTEKEVEFLTQSLKPKFNPVDPVVPASFEGVNRGLDAGPRDVVHFMCHGKSGALQTLMLEAPDTLDCSHVRVLAGFKTAFKNRPLAFLNACEVGAQIPALDGVGGFAHSFIQMGASAVIAPLWSVQDTVAVEVTKTFYPEALKGRAFGDIMKGIRGKAYSTAVDSYAAYCFYGDPMASIV